jgi:hypothetical protein
VFGPDRQSGPHARTDCRAADGADHLALDVAPDAAARHPGITFGSSDCIANAVAKPVGQCVTAARQPPGDDHDGSRAVRNR